MGWQEEYQQKIAALLERWQSNLEDLQHALPDLPVHLREPETRRMQDLEDTLREARVHLTELTNSDAAQWEFHHQAVERAMINVKRILDGIHLYRSENRSKVVKNTQSQSLDRSG